jgi:hypothetical protein
MANYRNLSHELWRELVHQARTWRGWTGRFAFPRTPQMLETCYQKTRALIQRRR